MKCRQEHGMDMRTFREKQKFKLQDRFLDVSLLSDAGFWGTVAFKGQIQIWSLDESSPAPSFQGS